MSHYHIEERPQQFKPSKWDVVHSESGARVFFSSYSDAMAMLLRLHLNRYGRLPASTDVEVRAAR